MKESVFKLRVPLFVTQTETLVWYTKKQLFIMSQFAAQKNIRVTKRSFHEEEHIVAIKMQFCF